MTMETPPLILLCYNHIQIYVPKTKEDIARARKLLDMLEDEINEDKQGGIRVVNDEAGLPHFEVEPNTKTKLFHGFIDESMPDVKIDKIKMEEDEIVEMTRQREESTKRRKTKTDLLSGDKHGELIKQAESIRKTDAEITSIIPDSWLSEARIRLLVGEPIRLGDNPVKISKDSAGDQDGLGTKTSEIPEISLNRKFDASVNFFIPKFEWDKTKEKNYRTIFFFEHEDGKRVMIFYLNSRVFTTKEAVMTLPYPVPFNYAPLRSIQNNKRTALKFYREYLAKEARSQEIDSAIRKDEQDKGVYDDIQLTGNEDEPLNEDTKESEDKRLEKLKKAAEVNKKRWEERVETEMPERTKELREKFGFGVIMQRKD